MNKKFYLLVFLFVTLFSSYRLNAQINTSAGKADSGWQPIYLLVTGDNTMDGVEASFQLTACSGEDVVFVRYVNHNGYAVKIEWTDALFTQGLKWVNEEDGKGKKSLVLPANAEAKGECLPQKSSTLQDGKHYPELVIKTKKFIADKKDFKRYSASQLTITAVQ